MGQQENVLCPEASIKDGEREKRIQKVLKKYQIHTILSITMWEVRRKKKKKQAKGDVWVRGRRMAVDINGRDFPEYPKTE